MRRFPAFVFLALLAISSVALAQTTGTIVGVVSDDSGGPLPGVTVEARGPALQGTKVTVTGTDGAYRLTLLPPGAYTCLGVAAPVRPRRADHAGPPRPQRDRGLPPPRDGARGGRRVGRGAGDRLDVDDARREHRASATIQSLPTGRDYGSVVQTVPGVVQDNAEPEGDSISVYGSSSAENAYLIDGVNTTNVEYGLEGKDLNFEFIQEIDVKTGGYEAEYGRSTGGIINVITKSGGNEFHGDLFGYYDDDSLQADNKHVGETLEGTALGFTRDDWGADLGGYILKDRLWFFAAYDRVTTDDAERADRGALRGGRGRVAERPQPRVRESSPGASRPDTRSSASFIQDPRTDSGAINDANHTLNGELATFLGTAGLRRTRLLAPVGRSLRLVARRCPRRAPATKSATRSAPRAPRATRSSSSTPARTTSRPAGSASSRRRTSSGTTMPSRRPASSAAARDQGRRRVRKGQRRRHQADVGRPAGHDLREPELEPGAADLSALLLDDRRTRRSTPFNAPDLRSSNASPEHKIWTAYLQDRWNVLSSLTLNLGIRWDRQEIIDASGATRITLDKDFAPRLGVIWNPGADKKTKVFGSFGLYYEEIPMDLVIRSFSFERQPNVYNFDPTGIVPDPAGRRGARLTDQHPRGIHRADGSRTWRTSTCGRSSWAPSARSCRTSRSGQSSSTGTTGR